MNARWHFVSICLLMGSLLLSACGPGQLPSPTITPSPTSTPTSTPPPTPTSTPTPATVTVTNSSDVINGDTTNITALNNDPGSDGISFREALIASNGTSGLKVISFHPVLFGATITFAADGDVLLLSSGELTIDGDINQDGEPDITLDGHLGQDATPTGPGLCIVSSNNTISGINLIDFAFAAIVIACPDAGCGTKFFINNRIINNHITGQRGMGISISPLGLLSVEEAPMLSDITWQDILISGNMIAVRSQAMYIDPAVGGGDRNRLINLTISDNQLSSEAEVNVDILVADVNSAYFGIPGPVDYSEDSLIENLIITNNVIEAPNGFGIHIICANYGNSGNQMHNVTIKNNSITNLKYTAISLTGGDGWGDRGSDNNLIANVEISQNTIAQTWVGISISGAGNGMQPGGINNRVENVLIADNAISDYSGVGIFLIGADSSSNEILDNLLDQVVISGNNIQQTINRGAGTGLDIRGGNSNGGISRRNIIQGLRILNNQISQNNIGIQIVGGSGIGAEDNQVIIAEMGENILIGNTMSDAIRDNADGASRNKVILLSK